MEIRELRILPPLAIGRLGAAASPMDNYTISIDPQRPLAPRTLRPAPTLAVDPATHELVDAGTPDTLRFTENGSVRPVAPFLEVWALTDNGLEPLTPALLSQNGDLAPANVRWRVQVANHKIYRRTGDAKDRIEADTGIIAHHEPVSLDGECEHFWPGKLLPLGRVQYIRPNVHHPGIRLRFTPAGGHVYGSGETLTPTRPDENIREILYDARAGSWQGHVDRPGPRLTVPAEIYAGKPAPDGSWVSLGYLDDECDGLVYVELITPDRHLSTYARIGAGPPAYAPDSFPIRTVADELEQAMFGPRPGPGEATLETAEEIVRRAAESVRLMNTAVMNGNTTDGRIDAASTMVRQDTADTGRLFEPIMAPSLVDRTALLHLHQNVLTALRSGTAPWFADVLRDHDEIGDLSAKGRRKMPALMRGADGRALALTRRQVALLRQIAQRDIFAADEPPPTDGDAGTTEADTHADAGTAEADTHAQHQEQE
ncbi:hypothetical protein [Embleya sp. NBC_00896]|uniref:hypothetical protein n=1 Tax=Embleya sp. NBC_00896 TaxID=2975961 RepID=UPI002F915A8F|nr:hypothetical protein OG928_35620 [Embleya sp. NBC_00896]